MEFLKVISVEQARDKLWTVFDRLDFGTAVTRIDDALLGVCAEDLRSGETVPAFDRSTVDGYAVRSCDTVGAGEAVPSLLQLAGEVHMGREPEMTIFPGQAAAIPTGGMLPGGADCTVMIEHTELFGDTQVCIHHPAAPGENIIRRGDDIREGEVILPAGRVITPLDIGALAAAGVAEVPLRKGPRVAIISTGDEVVGIEQPCPMGCVRDVNGHVLGAMVQQDGGKVTSHVMVKDNFDELRTKVEQGLQEADILLISGGSSVGARDYTYDVLESFGGKGVFINGIALKPGKPTMVAEINGKPVFGLPGHPVSAVMVYILLVRHLIFRVTGRNDSNHEITAVLSENLHSAPGKHTCQTVRLEHTPEGDLAVPVYGRSGLITLLTRSGGYIEIPPHMEGLEKGARVMIKRI